jgi:hypothetical protein
MDYLQVLPGDANKENQSVIINRLETVDQRLETYLEQIFNQIVESNGNGSTSQTQIISKLESLDQNLETYLTQILSQQQISNQDISPTQVVNTFTSGDMSSGLTLIQSPMVGKNKFTCFYEVLGQPSISSPLVIRMEYAGDSIVVKASSKGDTIIEEPITGAFSKEGITVDEVRLTLVTSSTDLYISKVVLNTF